MLKQLMIATTLAIASFAAVADEEPQKESVVVRDFGADRFAAGSSVRIDAPVSGDLLAAGGEVEVRAPIGGDAVLAGGRLRLDSSVAQGVYAAGGQLTVNGTIGRNARIAGGQVEFASGSQIAGNATVGGGDVKLRGTVKGYAQIAGGRVLLDGTVDGDVIASGGELELGPNARIGGKLRYGSRNAIKQDPAARIAGGVEQMKMPRGTQRDGHGERRFGGRGSWLWTIGLIVLALTLVGALPAVSRGVAETARTQPWLNVLIGFVLLVCVPVAALILLITIIGIPLALLLICLYLVLLLGGYVASCIALGEWALQRFRPAASGAMPWRLGAAALAVLVVALLARIPFLGGLVSLFALLLGVGAVVYSLVRRRPGAASPPAAA